MTNRKSGPAKGSKMHYHGHTKGGVTSKELSSYDNMIKRCHYEKAINYERYGGRGIKVCDRWRFGEQSKSGFECFLEDVGLQPDSETGYSLERPKNELGYEPGNVIWATRKQQALNRRSNIMVDVNGERLVLSEAIKKYAVVPEGTVRMRIRHGWDHVRALMTLGLTKEEKRARGLRAAAARWAMVPATEEDA